MGSDHLLSTWSTEGSDHVAVELKTDTKTWLKKNNKGNKVRALQNLRTEREKQLIHLIFVVVVVVPSAFLFFVSLHGIGC